MVRENTAVLLYCRTSRPSVGARFLISLFLAAHVSCSTAHADIHAHRVQTMVFGDSAAPEDIVQERFLEDELTLQSHLLKSETPDPYLFPEVVSDSKPELKEKLPHLQDGTAAAKLEEEKEIFFWEEMMEEGVLESLAICGMIGFLMMVPRLF